MGEDIGHKAVQDTLKNMYLVNIGTDKKLSAGYYLNPNSEYYAIDGNISDSSDSGSYGD